MNLRAFDLNLLLVFDTLMQERNVTRAAERLNLTQSSVSNALRRLREACGDDLFHKTPRGMDPTALALDMAPAVSRALAAAREAFDMNRPFDPPTASDEFVLGMSDYAEFVFGSRLVPMLRQRAPGVSVTIRHADRQNAVQMLDDDDIHVAVGVLPEPPPRMTQTMLLDDSFTVLMRAGHPAAGEALDLEAYLAYPHLLISATASKEGAVDRALEPLGRRRRLSVVASHLLMAGPMLRDSDLICTMSSRVAGPLGAAFGLITRDVPLAVRHSRISSVFHRRYEQRPAHIYLRGLLLDIAAELKRAG